MELFGTLGQHKNKFRIAHPAAYEHKRIDKTAHWHSLPALFWLSHHLAVVPQSRAKINFIVLFTP
jgi:hypothetical protein